MQTIVISAPLLLQPSLSSLSVSPDPRYLTDGTVGDGLSDGLQGISLPGHHCIYCI